MYHPFASCQGPACLCLWLQIHRLNVILIVTGFGQFLRGGLGKAAPLAPESNSCNSALPLCEINGVRPSPRNRIKGHFRFSALVQGRLLGGGQGRDDLRPKALDVVVGGFQSIVE